MESGLLIAGVRVGNESWDHHVTQGIHRMLGDTISSLLKESIASTSQQGTGSIWLKRRKRA